MPPFLVKLHIAFFAIDWAKFHLRVNAVDVRAQSGAQPDGDIIRRESTSTYLSKDKEDRADADDALEQGELELTQTDEMQTPWSYAAPHQQWQQAQVPQVPARASASPLASRSPSAAQPAAATSTTVPPPEAHCIIPQWGDKDFACKEAQVYWEDNWFDDNKTLLRKVMTAKGICTISCPKARYWQDADEKQMQCTKDGEWRSLGTGSVVRTIECSTAGRWWILFMLCGFVLPALAVRRLLQSVMQPEDTKDAKDPSGAGTGEQAWAEPTVAVPGTASS
eukprot:TRINITY_DN77930_c0_g1_i1.p1 TRINITY_DN77930_c0_g1~~TRINITY_DN77930_c0_g1_i1.p1  ORF type:complete len:279 (-),score=66.29 TRINITY_DN77930_c0_g1_i1:52-888(-)